MAYRALYRVWRPLSFDDVVGQDSTIITLKNEIKLGRVGHAYLFCGSRGTGKTSTARILSRAINCLNQQDGNPCNECENCVGILNGTILDITEIDAASNNGVDNIRSLRDEARFSGTALKHRVYIIDEVHMLSTSAFNALLKVLEEPPTHVHFILATTEAHKVPATILSRCQRFDFKRITVNDIEKQIKKILSDSDVAIEDSAIRLIAEKADGAMRDALSLLDQCLSIGTNSLDYKTVSVFLGADNKEITYKLVNSIKSKDIKGAFDAVASLVDSGQNIPAVTDEFIALLRNLMLCKYSENLSVSLNVSEEEAEELTELANGITSEYIVYLIKQASEAQAMFRTTVNPRLILEVSLVKMINPIYSSTPEAISARIAELENKIATGNITAAPKNKKEESSKNSEPALPPPVKMVADSELLQKLKNSWSDILGELFTKNKLQIAMALERAELEEENGKVAIVYNNKDEFFVSKNLIEGDIDSFCEIVRNQTSLTPEFILRLREEGKIIKDDALIKLYNNIIKENM